MPLKFCWVIWIVGKLIIIVSTRIILCLPGLMLEVSTLCVLIKGFYEFIQEMTSMALVQGSSGTEMMVLGNQRFLMRILALTVILRLTGRPGKFPKQFFRFRKACFWVKI